MEQRKVSLSDAFEQQKTKAVVVKRQLNGDEPTEEVPNLRSRHRDGGHQSISQHVLIHHGAVGEALQTSGPRVVGVERFDHSGSGDSCDVSKEDHDQAQGREEEMFVLLKDSGSIWGGGRDRKPFESHAKDEDEEHRPHELGNHGSRKPADGNDSIDGFSPFQGGHDAPENAGRNDEQERQCSELGGQPDGRTDFFADRN